MDLIWICKCGTPDCRFEHCRRHARIQQLRPSIPSVARRAAQGVETEQSWSWLRQFRQQRIPDEAHATTNSSSSHWLHALSSPGGVQHERLGVYMEQDHRYGKTE